MTSLLSISDISVNSEGKHYHMKQFISASSTYIKTRTEESASIINRHLQLLAVAIDYSIFDPNTSIVCEFFVSLRELLTSLEPHSGLAWCCISVLSVACKNSAARHHLIHVYDFIPSMSRLLGDHLAVEKKIRLLSVMQELSCGMKISWLIPHLSHLMTTLTRWLDQEAQCEQVTTLSLGVLVNLCYKNLPAIYTLSKCTNVKELIRTCSRLKGVQREVHACRLLIILDYLHGSVPPSSFLKLITVTFKSVKETFEAKDPIVFRQIVDFYLDIAQNEKNVINNRDDIIRNYTDIHIEVEQIINIADNKHINASGDASHHDPECMAILFKFLQSLIVLNLPNLHNIHLKLVRLSLQWVQTELACSEALNILRTIVVNLQVKDPEVLENLIKAIPIFLVGLQNVEEDTIMNIEYCKRLSAVMQLLRALVQADNMRERVMSSLNEAMICKMFVPLIGNTSPRARAADANNCTPEAVTLYVNTLALINELARYSMDWIAPLSTLFQHKEMHVILAEALYRGNEVTKALILTMASYHLFPYSEVAAAMKDMQPLIKSSGPNPDWINNLMSYPMMSVQQAEKLDGTIQLLKDSCKSGAINVSTSDVMELYEYRLAAMGHAERAASASITAATEQCTHLKLQTAQLTNEISRIRQLFIHNEQCSEEIRKINLEMKQSMKDLSNRLEAEKGRSRVYQDAAEKKDILLREKSNLIEDYTKQLEEYKVDKDNLAKEKEQFLLTTKKLEENLKRQEKQNEKKEEMLKKINASLEHSQKRGGQLEMKVKQLEGDLRLRTEELSRVTKELSEKSDLLAMITRLTNQNKQ